MGIGPGIVTRSAKRPKYKLDAKPKITNPARFYHRKRYTMVTRYHYGKLLVDFWPNFNAKEKWQVTRSLRKMLTDEEYREFCRALCDRSEKIGFVFPDYLERMVDDFIKQYPRWRPEKNRLRWRDRVPKY